MEGDPSSHRAASDMLEDALQQFDSILSSGPVDVNGSGEFVADGLHGISQLLDDLRITIQAEQMTPDESGKLLSLLSAETLIFYQDLFKKPIDGVDAKSVQKLKNENDSLSLQVSVLTDQVELQMEKMEELIETSKDLQNKLLSTEELLQKEIQINTEREREMILLREKVRLQAKTLNEHATSSPQKVFKARAEVLKQEGPVSPDEGIVNDVVDGLERTKLKMPVPTATSTPISTAPATQERHTVKFEDEISKNNDFLTPKKSPTQQFKSVSLERLQGKRILTNPESSALKKSSSQSDDVNKVDKNVSIPKAQTNQTNNAKSCSSPNLALTEIRNDDELVQNRRNIDPLEHEESIGASPFHNRKKHGFKKFFSSFRLRRSHSSSLQSSEVTSLQSWSGKESKNQNVKISGRPEPFQRGGFRATAGPRLGWTKPKVSVTNTKPFAQWTTQEVAEWFEELGLDSYVYNCKIWVKSGATLLQATNEDIEKELGVHNPLHKKKLMLSLQAVGEEDEVEGQIIKGVGMDHVTVARWLDDIGLPQYKDAFHKARIDCRMLHHLTIGDLHRLRITNLLHTLSFRRAIYTLRKLNFDPSQLKRRPVEGENEQVDLWTNHRVMEWLRFIDLAEYAPNLRGSGVHGSLMVYEPQFTGEILASLLHIPSSKSLLRRHLVSKFNDIISAESLSQKQKEASLTAVNIMAKVKIGKRSFGPLARLRGLGSGAYREFSSGEYVCPFETKNSAGQQSLNAQRRKLDAKLQFHDKTESWEGADSASDDSNNIKVVELDENATKKIGAFSAELATMTNKWSED